MSSESIFESNRKIDKMIQLLKLHKIFIELPKKHHCTQNIW